MANGSEVMTHFFPNGGFYIQGNDFSTVFYDEGVTPITKKQFDDTFKIIDDINAQKQADKAAMKSAILARLGLTAEEAATLLS
jgi:hypothetical protein